MVLKNENSVLQPIDFAVTLLSILEIRRVPTFFLKLLSYLAILLYFGQMLSYLVSFDLPATHDRSLEFWRKVIFYSNYSNFLFYFQLDWLTSFMLYLCYGFSFGVPFYIVLRTFLSKKCQFFLKNYRMAFSTFDSLIADILLFYIWAIQTPILEVLIDVLECGPDSLYKASRANLCPPISTPILIFSILSCFLNVSLGILIVLINRNYEFFHTGVTTPLKSENSPIFAIIYLLKCVFPLGHPIMKNYQSIYFLLLAIIIVLSLLDFSKKPLFREIGVSRIYVSSLMFTMSIVLVSFFSVYSSLIPQEDFVNISAILGLIFIKTGLSFSNFLYCRRILQDFTDIHILDFLAEEVLTLQYHAELSKSDRLYFLGMLRKHARNCTVKDCRLREKNLIAIEENDAQTLLRRVFAFVAQIFERKIKAIVKKSESAQFYELLLLKYVSFLVKSRYTGLKALYELQKFRSIAPKSLSFNFKVIAKVIKKEIKERLDRAEAERTLKSENKHLFEMKVSDFFKVDAEKRLMEKKTKKLLGEKLKFWERFKDGFKSYEELIATVYSLINKIKDFEKLLKDSLQPKGVIALKFNSILHSLLLNSINEATKYEDEIDNFKKKCFNVDREIITDISFFDRNFCVLQVSLLNLKGQLLETGKTPKLAEIFGYQMIDLKNVNFISQLMPPIISAKHEQMISKSLNRDANDIRSAKKTITSFAQDRKGYIFKIRVYFTHSYQHHADFVMNASILRVEEKSRRPQIIFDNQGEIQGMNEDFYIFIRQQTENNNNIESFKNYISEIALIDYNLLNIFALMPKLKEILARNEVFKERTQTIRNETGVFDIPENLKEIIEKLKIKQKNILDNPDQNTAVSKFILNYAKSSKSKASTPNKIQKSFGNNSTFGTVVTEKNVEQIILENAGETIKFRLNFDLLVQNFMYGKNVDESITIINLHVIKIQSLKKDQLIDNKDPKSPNNEPALQTIQNDTLPQQPLIMNLSNIQPIPMTIRNSDGEETLNGSPSNFLQMPANNSFAFLEHGKVINKNDEKHDEEIINAVRPENPTIPQDQAKQIQEISQQIDNVIFAKSGVVMNIQNDHDTSNSYQREPLNTERFDLPDLLAKQSQKASSVTSTKKTFGIFNIIKEVQEKVPLSIRQLVGLSLLELIIIIVNCAFLYNVCVSYINGSYLPLQASMINFCKSSVDFNFGVLSVSKYEYWYYNYSTTGVNLTTLSEYNSIIQTSVAEGTKVLYDEMNKPVYFAYQNLIKTQTRTFIDYLTKKVSNITYIPMFQLFIDVLNEFKDDSVQQIFNNKKYLNILPRNYYYFYQLNNQIITSIQTDFQNSNSSVTTQFENLMIISISIFAILALLKLVQFSFYNTKIMKILNIILRMKSIQIFNEISLLKEMIKIFEDPFDSYLNTYFSEKVLNLQNIISDDTNEAVRKFENANEFKFKLKSKEKGKLKPSVNKKLALLNIKPLSKLRPVIFLGVIFGVSFAYLYSNFYMWSKTNSTINDLININISFNKLYYYSAFLLLADNMMIREKIIRDQDYESSGEPTQTMDSRLASFNRSYLARLADFNNYISMISQYGIGIQSDYNDADYTNILQGNLCNALKKSGTINAYEFRFCGTGLNNAFLQGLPGVLNEFRNNLLAYANMTNLVPKNDSLNNKIQIATIKKFVSGKNLTDSNMGGYLACKSVLIFYNKVNDYYYRILTQNINAFLVFLVIMSCFCVFFFGLGAVLGYKYLRKIYCDVCWSLMLIPHEKLINDEQISFLIKQLAKDK